ncbi:MAG: hypothetical protein KF770_19740 [Anaerolineae bacterium]|nr:hypothetical protein [Anaerolineae bacterium]
MYLQLHRLTIHLDSEYTAVNQAWRWLFDGWLVDQPAQVDIRLQMNLVDELPSLPTSALIFTDSRPLPDDIGVLSVYAAGPDVVWLFYHDGALVQASLAATVAQPTIRGVVMPSALTYGRLEDITFTSLASALRRQGYYLVHAFAAAKDGRAVLIVGASGSGKTTAGLSLLLGGWQLLANDILLLESRDDGLYALPTPGGVSIRPATFDLLPALKEWLIVRSSGSSVAVSAQQLTRGQWAEPARVAAIWLPQIEATRPCSQLQPANRAIALVRLLEESADRWDAAALDAHVNMMEQLAQQTAVYHLLLGQDVVNLPELIEGVLQSAE